MIYFWCSACGSRYCSNEQSHRAEKKVGYRADFMLGGRYGKRIRKLFSNKKDAEAYEYVTLADFKRGTFLPVSKSKITVDELFNDYQQHVTMYQKGAKVELYRLGNFKEIFGRRPLHTLEAKDWLQYIKGRSDVTQSTLNRDLTAIKVMFEYCVTNSILATNPFEAVKPFKVDDIKVRWLDDKEIESVLTACTTLGDLDMRDLLVFALNAGFRKANLQAVNAHDINGQRLWARKTKSGKEYYVPIDSTLATLLQRLILSHPSEPLLNFKNFRRRFDAVMAASLKDDSVTLHTFRHTFAAQCLKKGIPIDRVCAWMGHHSVEFTRKHYGHLCPNQEAAEINLLNLGSPVVRPHGESNAGLQIENLPS